MMTHISRQWDWLVDVAEGAFIFLGIGDATLQTDQKLHTPRFRMDDSMLLVGATLHASVAIQYLQDKQQQKPHVSSSSHITSIEL